jgi:peptidoglycan-associated lipoprotein
MQKAPSQIASGNIAPAIAGPNKDMKDVYVLAALVLFLAGVIGAFWFYSQDQAGSSINSEDQLNGTQVSNVLKNTTATNPISESVTKAVSTAAPAAIGDIAHSDIYFEVGRKGLTDEAKTILATQAEILKQDADWGLLAQGYTDQQGSASYNKKLGLMRAEKVKEHLVGLGVSDQNIKAVSLGEEGVLCVDSSDTCRHMNRRVHLEMRKIGQEHMVAPAVAAEAPATEPHQASIDSSADSTDGGSLSDGLVPSTALPQPTDPASGS